MTSSAGQIAIGGLACMVTFFLLSMLFVPWFAAICAILIGSVISTVP